ncbi:hypothetical protein DYY88_23885 [Leptolyngbya iicbica LK]|uniref:Uncharacterized protein n=1 Tax=Leptolyngbya iicbica LK TaxID=2294035 RepID=A0A4Q7DZM9_9CYAN|nr:hypothetical protein [Leptolyngbya sp. LK]RZM74090.1 hypothetical protein DYY88_23885 [Leptolyngbya sp. LK]
MIHNPNPPHRLGDFLSSSDGPDVLRVIAVGSPEAVDQHVMQMYLLRYAETHEWSRPLPTVNPNEVMRILTKRMRGLGNHPTPPS